MLSIALVLAVGALLSANAASNSVPPSSAGEFTAPGPLPTFAAQYISGYSNTLGYSAVRSDGGAIPPIVGFVASYPVADAVQSVQVSAIRDGRVDGSGTVTLVLSDLGPAPYADPVLVDMQQLTAADATAWSAVDSLRVDFYDAEAALLGTAYLLR